MGSFDNINHEALVKKLSTYPQLAQAVKAWLQAGALDGDVFVETPSGTPQGGVISPLLANIALHGMETAIIGAYPSGQHPHVVRYADDFVVLHPTEEGVRKAQVRAATWLADMGLEMKASKTRIAHTLHPINGQAGFDFLGFVRHGSCTRGCCDRAIGTQPGILLPVPYQDMRATQTVKGECDC